MAASRARLEALLARVQKRAGEPRTPSVPASPILEAVKGDAPASRALSAVAAVAEAPASSRSARAAAAGVQRGAAIVRSPISSSASAIPQNEVDDDIEEYDDELIEIIDDAEVIPQSVAAARAIEPAAFGAAVDRRPSAPIRAEPVRAGPASSSSSKARPEARVPEAVALRPEAVAPRPVAASEVARARSSRRELRHNSFIELLDASLKLG